MRKPTRGQYLLDLVLTDFGIEVKAKVVRNISDHEAVLGTLEFDIDEVFASERTVYDFQKASWTELTHCFVISIGLRHFGTAVLTPRRNAC